ncbi:hypothetical protein F4809DRAFT_396257 [Biscogniauxia mediterranea]|nr:hypothetical protein F4809DRAFT_396257 [Biscogniauxia mediterranea]
MPSSRSPLDSADAREAQQEAVRGAAVGAVKWGAASAVLGGIGYVLSPVYRGLTIQFKVYLQMSGMIVGSMIEADHRMRQYEQRVRIQRRIARDRAVWDSLLDDDEDDEGAQVPPSPKK